MERVNIPSDCFVIIIGAMKCGTTSLYEYLIQNSLFCPCKTKEPEFFSSKQNHGINITRYENLWKFDPFVHKYVIEASTGYTKYPLEKNVPEKMVKYGIKPYLIYIVRNPFDRIESHINWSIMRNTFTKNARIIPDHYINVSKYYMQIKQYEKYFDRSNILVINFDTFITDIQGTLQKVYKFLNLECYIPENIRIYKKSEKLSTLELKIIRSNMGIIYKKLPKYIIKSLRMIFNNISDEVLQKKLSNEQREYIHEKIAFDMQRLKEHWNINVNKWGF